MSRTYKKYPMCYYLSGGVIFKDFDDIPTTTRWYKYTSHPPKKSLIRVWYDGYHDKTGAMYTYFKMKEVTGYDYSITKTTWHEYTERVPYETVCYYDKKSSEGFHNNRIWRYHGVGKINKRLRKKKHRAEARHIIDRWMQYDFDCDIPIEKNHDRWDAW